MRRLALLALALTIAAPPARAHLGAHEIAVREGYYEPSELRIDPGETVTWNALAGGHTVTADDRRFDFPPDRLSQQGDRFEWTFTEDETFFYHCKVHGSMFGVIIVGEGTPSIPPSDDPPEVRRVPADYPNISTAVADAKPNTIVEIAPRSYVESVRVNIPGLVLRGTGASPADVRVEGGSIRGIGIEVAAPGVRIEQLTVRRTTFAGIFVNGAARTTITDVALEGNDRYGVRLVGVRGATLRRVHASASLRAGVSVADCRTCDVVIEDALLERNLAGVSVHNAAGVVVRRSTIRGNGTGIALTSVATAPTSPLSGVHLYGNLILDNLYLPSKPPPVNEQLEIPSGAGIWISGGRQVVVEANTVSGHLYGIAVTGIPAPAVGVRITGNTLANATAADLAWDGVGLGVCFQANVTDAGGDPSSEPPALTTTAACGPVPTVGAPYPVVWARILAHGL